MNNIIDHLNIRLTEIDNLRRLIDVENKKHKKLIESINEKIVAQRNQGVLDRFIFIKKMLPINALFRVTYFSSMKNLYNGPNVLASRIKKCNWSGGQMRVPNV